MSIERTTKRNSAIWNDQYTARRARESEPAVTYIVVWQYRSTRMVNQNHFDTRQSKPTNRLSDAVKKFEHRTQHAVFVELQRYDDDGMKIVRRFCNLARYRECARDTSWVLSVKNPPYEIVDEA